MAQKRFGIVLNNGKAISGAGVFVLILTFIVFFPCAVGALVHLATVLTTFEVVLSSLSILIGPALLTFALGLFVLKLLRVPFLRPAHEVEGPPDGGVPGAAEKAMLGMALHAAEIKNHRQAGGGKLWWVWRAFAGLMAIALIVAGIKGLVEGNNKSILLLAVGVAAAVVAISGRDVAGG